MRAICWIFGAYVILICLLRIALMHLTAKHRTEENEYKQNLKELEVMEDD